MNLENMKRWAGKNLFSSRYNAVLTLISGIVLGLFLWFSLKWMFFSADWSVIPKIGLQFLIGQYNTEVACASKDCLWRPAATVLASAFFLGLLWGFTKDRLARNAAFIFASLFSAFAVLSYRNEEISILLRLMLISSFAFLFLGYFSSRLIKNMKLVILAGVLCFLLSLLFLHGIPGSDLLKPVSVIYWGGLMLNLLLSVSGIVLCFPIGILLALGRRSNLHVIKIICVLFIESFRGVPLIALLFMSQTIIPLAFPENFPLNSFYRAAIIITLFSSAYMAENIRGGLQALHPGQAEAARALGFSGAQTTLLISLPQAIKNVIPAIAGQFISLFKDTNLVYIIGMLDMVGIGRAFITGNPQFLASSHELFIFLAFSFGILAYAMSHASSYVEKKLSHGRKMSMETV